MRWVRGQLPGRPLGVVVAAVLLAAVAGAMTGGVGGAGTAVLAAGLAALVLVVLRSGVGLAVGDAPVDWPVVLAGGVGVVAVVVLAQYGLEGRLGGRPALAALALAVAAIGALVGRRVDADPAVGGSRDPLAAHLATGAGHGLLGGGVGGLLFVPVAAYESLAMQPALTVALLLGAVLAPLALAAAGAVGGAIGGALVARDRAGR